jgi:hypothetical protein
VKYLDRIANIAIIVAVAVFLSVIIRREFFQRPPAPAHSPRALVGTTIRLPGVHLSAQHDSLVLGISTSCHYCSESLPFYREVMERIQGRIDVFAVLPQTQAEGSRYLADAGLTAVRTVSLILPRSASTLRPPCC